MLDTNKIKKDFPIFNKQPDLVYLDSTATSLKPQSVISKLDEYYSDYSANIFRGVYDMSEKATAEYEETRTVVKNFINAPLTEEIIFTRNATESINLFVSGIKDIFKKGDEIVTTITEHHSNFVPWQQLAKNIQCSFKIISINEEGILEPQLTYEITKKTKILALTYVSNVLGTVNPIKTIIKEAKNISPHIIVLVDGAQAVPHLKVDVTDLGCDAFVFSSHKMLGPTGVGVLWVKKELLETFPPYQFGGDMIRSVAIEETQFADLPHRFEAGTPHIAGVIALKEASHYLQGIGLDAIHSYEVELAQICYDRLTEEFGTKIKIIGPQKRESGIVAFAVTGLHAHDVAQLLNEDHIAVRAGHHCAMPLHTKLGIEASVRASFYLYNTKEDVEKLIASLHKALHLFK
ncbi:cysteine desulfurase CsdA [Candidatus Roizmanbacteria bacterium CG_4_10_14_3_um_filter_39_13]|uniref:Cysteine desulfurase n=2 Tax=Candidatus Roizmaniibacteriota TaxID=1752723 RepID=A0A2M7LL46_9BACT|nr:MAG: cysteine desulfurase CsdA [Candidatus Roizmanbacteria bacterium CG03_land_8_20_14_0_80_39_12]PIX68788.1 MAG: cysteine desulfurase CsdA [Candidatus Roizmanbacteria bacterium CG_4_10_14_3_um_filter_39_13]